MFIMSFDFAVDVVIILWPPVSSKEDRGKYDDDGPKHKKGTGVNRDMNGGRTIAIEEVVFSESFMSIIVLLASSLFLN